MARLERRTRLGLSLLAISGCIGCSRSDVAGVGGAQAGSGSLRDPERENCRNVTLEGEVATVAIPGTVLLVFDRSGSMAEPWNERPRWEVAGEAIVNALLAQSSMLTVGAVFFPSPDRTETCVDPTGIACMFVPELTIGTGTCKVEPIEASDQIGFVPSPDFLDAFLGDPAGGALPKYAPVMGGMTPLTEALQVARSALRDRAQGGVTSVVIITDGEPNCEWDEARANEVVDGWHAAGIVTYVVGLPGLRNTARPILDGLAEAGGSDVHITPDDADAIEQSLGEIFEQNVSLGFDSCSLQLDPPARMPDELHVIVTERGREHVLARLDDGGEAAYRIAPGGATVELVGNTCAAARSGAYRSIRLEFDCAAARSSQR